MFQDLSATNCNGAEQFFYVMHNVELTHAIDIFHSAPLIWEDIHSHFSGSTLDTTVGHQSPVVPLAGAERTLPGFFVNLHLKRLHVCLIFLIGCKAYSWEGHSKHVLALILNLRTI